jgi:DNA polymerase
LQHLEPRQLERLAQAAEATAGRWIPLPFRHTTVVQYLVLQDLAAIYEYVTGEVASRRVRGEDHPEAGRDYGPFWDFAVIAWRISQFEFRSDGMAGSHGTEIRLARAAPGTMGLHCRTGGGKAGLADLQSRADLPEMVRKVLAVRAEAAKSSTAKLRAYRDYAGSDGRLRDNLLYLGASRTGRFSGKGAQVQNLPRGVIKDVERAVAAILSGDPNRIAGLPHPPLDVVSSCLRACLTAGPGKRLIAADFSNIEGRVLAWLAGEERTLQAFRDFDAGTGPDVYKTTAAGIYEVSVADVTSDQRTIGKVATLALGYGGGHGAFQTMAKAYGLEIEDARADDIKIGWRKANPRIVQLWSRCARAAVLAVQHPGTEIKAGRISYLCDAGVLWCRLPSGRTLVYRTPHFHETIRPWGEAAPSLCFWGADTYTTKWSRIALYGGLLVENVTQACARDLLVEAMLRTEAAGYHIVLSVHDEIVAEVAEEFGSLEEFEALMSAAPPWAEGCPIAADGWVGVRFKKK